MNHSRHNMTQRRQQGFSLIETLVALLLAAVVMPIAVQAVTNAATQATLAKRTRIAAMLSQNKVSEVIMGDEIDVGEESGDFGEDYPGFSWKTIVTNYDTDTLQQVEVSVMFSHQGNERSIDLTTLIYVPDEQ